MLNTNRTRKDDDYMKKKKLHIQRIEKYISLKIKIQKSLMNMQYNLSLLKIKLKATLINPRAIKMKSFNVLGYFYAQNYFDL